MKALNEVIFRFKLLFFPAKSTIQLFLPSHLWDIGDLFFIISENYWRIKKETVLNTTSSKEKVFHWNVPHLQQKALKDSEKGKQPVKPSYAGWFFIQDAIWFLIFVYCRKQLFSFPLTPQSVYVYHCNLKINCEAKKWLEKLHFEGGAPRSYSHCVRPIQKATSMWAEEQLFT